MTTSSPDLDRKVRQLDNDVHAVYEMITKVHGTLQLHTTRLDGIDAGLGEMNTRLDTVETRLDTVETRLDTVETRLGGVETGLVGVGTKVDEVLRRLPAA